MTPLRILLAGLVLIAALLIASANMSPLPGLLGQWGGVYSSIANIWPRVSGWLWKGRAERAEAVAAVATAEIAQAEKTDAAGKAARNQNDVAIPRIRAATATRIDRPDSGSDADRAIRLRDDTEAVADYRAAADRLSRAQPR